MDINTAKQIQEICVEIRRKQNAIIMIARDSCDPDEYRNIRRTMGGLMSDQFMKISQNIFRQHPSLCPDELLRNDGSNPYL